MSIIRNYERVAYGYKEEHVCPSCFTAKLHPALQNLYTIEFTRSCWQNLEMIKNIKCAMCKQVIMFVRREIRQIVSKHPLIEIHLEGSPIYSYVNTINTTGHLNSRAVLWYNDCVLKVTSDIVTMWLNAGMVAPIRPTAVPLGNNDQPNRSNETSCNSINSVAGMRVCKKLISHTAKNIVTGYDTGQRGSSASGCSGVTPIDLCAQNTNFQRLDESSAPRNRSEQTPAGACSSKDMELELESRVQTGDKEHEEGNLAPKFLGIGKIDTKYLTNLGREREASSEEEPEVKYSRQE